ncbi:protein SPT2 homolog [Saccostrea echinata]|uniref:protein SPT2 homolog n=1 Tax=Saccostrea echinata TaxID=191078 RepID=UPI002A8095E7|nr:protein SPT2 homolog [Saccostrea echinata]
MDFQNILSIAAQNSSSKQVKKVFSTQLAPPKKEKKDKEVKSEIVKKLIEEKEREKREAEEARERIKRKIEEAKERKKREKELKLKREKEEEERRRKEEEKRNRFKIPKKGESTTDKNDIKSSTSSSSGSTSTSISSKARTASVAGKNALLKNSESRKSDVIKKHKPDAKVKNHVDKVSDKLKNSSGNGEDEKIDPTTVKPTAISSQQRSSHLYDSIEKKKIKNETEVERKRREFEEKRARLLQQIKAKGVEIEKPVVVRKTEKSKSSKDSDKKSEKKSKSEKQSEQEKISDKLNNKSSTTSVRQELSKPSVSEKIKAHNSGKKMPPPMGFSDLLKLAQVKASEPVTMESLKKVDKPKKETDRLMTKEERDRYMEEQACRQRKTSLMGKAQTSSGNINDKSSSSKRENNDGNSKHSKEKSIRESREDRSSPKLKNLLINGVKSSSPETSKMNSTLKRKSEAYPNSKPSSHMISKSSSSSALHRPHDNSDAKKRRVDSPSMSKGSTGSPSLGRPNGQSSHKPAEKRRAYDSENENVLVCGPPKQKPEAALNPFDRIYGQIKKNHPKPEMKKRRIESDEEDSEYDEEMEGFITDEGSDLEEDYPQDMDYSKHIRQIFGYDRRKYKYESDRDIANMESNFAQQMKEEARSARLGLQEDLEDIRREEEELKRKMEKKKR